MTTRIYSVRCLLALCVAAHTAAAAPQITQTEPFALQPGKTIELTLRGQNLKDAGQLWTTFASRAEFVPPSDETSNKGETVRCRVTVPRDEQVGIGALRVVTNDGPSSPVLLMVDDLRSAPEAAENHTLAEAQMIQPPIAIDGQCDAIQEDFYRFRAEAGQAISVEVVAQRLGSQLDPVIRLLTADGNPIDRSDDAEGAGGDTRFVHQFTSAGDFILAVSDVRHLGGPGYGYRLRVGAFPLVTTVYPLGGRRGSVMSFDLTGYAIDPQTKLNLATPAEPARRALAAFGIPGGNGAGSGWFSVETSNAQETLEAEPNDTPSAATAGKFPGVINGRIDRAGDRDHFKFAAHKGQHLHCVAKTRELGSTCDIDFSLHQGDGTKLAAANQGRQTVLDADIGEDGDYILQVTNLYAGEAVNTRHAYRIDLSETYPGFELRTPELQYAVPLGGTVAVKVIADRHGYGGPIELAVEGWGDGITLAGNTFDGPETLLKITVPPTIATGEFRLVRILGKAKVGDRTVTVAANEREVLRAQFPNTPSLPAELEDTIAFGVGPPFPPFYGLTAAPEVYFPQIVGAASFEVNITRMNAAFKDAVALSVEGLPKEITAKIEPVGDGSAAVRVALTGPADCAEGEHALRVIGMATFQDQTRRVVLDNIKLAVTKPLVVSASLEGPVPVGGEQQAIVKLQRFGNNPQPIRLQVSDGPPGIVAPVFVTVPAESGAAKVPISTLRDAAPGKFENFVLVATTQVNGQNVSVRSKPAAIEIQPPPAK